jgi:hypothetical protein
MRGFGRLLLRMVSSFGFWGRTFEGEMLGEVYGVAVDEVACYDGHTGWNGDVRGW